ncbi:MAG: DNA adenine methylase [Nitrososphaerota archaeon]|nr:DNA adenine methylase [Nitrososphaerota archaeon]MDG7043453.1 DNA adenine methylase [Nitrososphaerota archaeon]
MVSNIPYFYFYYYDNETKDKKEIYCGPQSNNQAREKAKALEEDYLQKQIVTHQGQLEALQLQLKTLQEEGLVQYERPAARPFVKWAGGKSQLLAKLRKHFPKAFNRYYEPFLGGGAVFFHLVNIRNPFPATISDINRDLINAYKVIQDDVEGLIADLRDRQEEFRRQSDKALYFNKVRDAPPPVEDKVRRAGWFILMNKTCYNGLYRVNSQGKFNVPYGDYAKVKLCDADNLMAIHHILSQDGVDILREDYRKSLRGANEASFCYLDPPYYPLTNGGFTSYTPEAFSKEDQEDLKKTVDMLTDKGCKVLMSNSDSEFIRELYRDYTITAVDALRMINSDKAGRKGISELIIRNY